MSREWWRIKKTKNHRFCRKNRITQSEYCWIINSDRRENDFSIEMIVKRIHFLHFTFFFFREEKLWSVILNVLLSHCFLFLVISEMRMCLEEATAQIWSNYLLMRRIFPRYRKRESERWLLKRFPGMWGVVHFTQLYRFDSVTEAGSLWGFCF